MNWLDLYLACTRDRTAFNAGVAVVDGMTDRDAEFRNGVYRRADRIGFPRCHYRAAETICAGMDAWSRFTATADVHALADAMLELDELSGAKP